MVTPTSDPLRLVALVRATDLARGGAFEQAEALLDASAAAPSVAELDLRARIRAQQGRRDEASALWSAAARLAGDETRFSSNRARAADSGRGVAGAVVRVAAAAALVVVGVAIGRLMLSPGQPPSAVETRTVAMAPLGIAATGGNQSGVRRPVPPAAAGTTAISAGDAVIVSFDAPLFLAGTRITGPGRAALARLGRVLADRSDARLEVVGFADSVPVVATSRHGNNARLALARAIRVFDALAAAGVDVRRLSIRSEGDVGPLVRPTTHQRGRRTVELRLTAGPDAD